jgi:hypothetical protein
VQRSVAISIVIACLAALALAGCGASSSSSASGGGSATTSTTHFAKTKFVLHMGLAIGAFHRYIWKPYKAGTFHSLFSHKIALLKAAIASLFIYHELKLAASDVHSSKILSALFAPVTALAAKVSALRSQLLHGQFTPSDIESVQNDAGSISSQASSKGQSITDLAGSVPGL